MKKPSTATSISRRGEPREVELAGAKALFKEETRKDEERNLGGKHCLQKSGDRDGDGQLRGLHFGDSKLKSLSKASMLVRPEKW